MNPQTRNLQGYYWIIDGPTNVHCGMNYTGQSCQHIYNNNPQTGNRNGYYPINNSQWTFCNMTAIVAANTISSCAGVGGQWKRIVSINITAGDECPTGWYKSSNNGVSFYRAPSDDTGCHPIVFSTNVNMEELEDIRRILSISFQFTINNKFLLC